MNKKGETKMIQRINLRCIFVLIIFLLFAFIHCSDNPAGSKYIPAQLEGSTWEMFTSPESAGWSSSRLQAAYAYSQRIQTAAVMVIYDGKVLYHWGDITRKFWTHSCRKSFMSALYGVHVDEGNIDISKTLADLGIDDSPYQLTAVEKTATVRMLLQARSGVYIPAAAEAPSMSASRPARHSHPPGTFWYYNNWDFNTLCTIFDQETGTKFFEELKRRIFDPIGTEDFQVTDGFYQYVPTSKHPSYPFRITARDMARFGLLFLRNGVWEGTRIISEEWIRESTTSYSDAGYTGGYGYMWWIAQNGYHLTNVILQDDAYSARGYGGHYIVVIPDKDVVVVHRVNTDIGNSVTSSEFGALLNFILDAKEN